MIEFNFKTRNPREVNWYLREYVGCVKTTQDGKNYTFEGADPEKAAIYIPLRANFFRSPNGRWKRKAEEAIRRSFKLLPAETVKVLEAMLTPEALAVMGAVTAVFAASHFIGVGEIADLILLGVGTILAGNRGWQALDELQSFVHEADAAVVEEGPRKPARSISPRPPRCWACNSSRPSCSKRAKTFKKSQGIEEQVGSRKHAQDSRQSVLPKPLAGTVEQAGGGRRDVDLGRHLVFDQGKHRRTEAGENSRTDPFLVDAQVTVPAQLRVELGINSYKKSYILRYLEEAIAETVAQVAVNKNFITGIKFPVKKGYVTIVELAEEAAGILMGTVNIAGQACTAKFSGSGAASA